MLNRTKIFFQTQTSHRPPIIDLDLQTRPSEGPNTASV